MDLRLNLTFEGFEDRRFSSDEFVTKLELLLEGWIVKESEGRGLRLGIEDERNIGRGRLEGSLL
jgi:hypothetical protein